MRYLLLYNPVSGKGKFKKQLPLIKKYFSNKNLLLDVYESKHPKDLEQKAKSLGNVYDVVIISGGDGTVNEVINGIMKLDRKPHIAVIPSGTANDVASILGMKKCVKKSLDIITETKPIKMDVNMLNDRYFLYTTAAGVLTKISYDVSRDLIKRFGYFAYLAEGAKDIFKNYKMRMEIIHDKGITKGEYMLVLGLTSKRVGGLSLRRFSKSKIDDGKFDLRLIGNNKFFRLAKLGLFFISGGFYKSRQDIHLSSSKYIINTSNDVIWNTDGERSMTGSIEIRVLNKAIKVYASNRSKKKHFT